MKMFPLLQLTIAQKAVLLVSLPVTGLLLYLLMRKRRDDEEAAMDDRGVVTSRQTVIEVAIPRDDVGTVIGHQGAQIKEIQSVTGARVNFKDDMAPDGSERTLVIRGSQTGAQEAELMIRKLLADQPDVVTDTMLVPQQCVGRIIGKGGDSIRQISRTSKAKVNIERSEESRPDGLKEVTLKGTPAAVSTAKALIQEKVEEEEVFRAKASVAAANRQQRGKKPKHEPVLSASSEEGLEASQYIHVTAAQLTAPAGPVTERVERRVEVPPEAAATGAAGASLRDEWPRYKDFLEVYVSAVEHPGHFWVQVLSSKSTQLDRLVERMTGYYGGAGVAGGPSRAQGARASRPRVGDVVAVPFEHDNMWYRARVMEDVTDEATAIDVYYVDFGDNGLVPKDKVMTLRSDFFSLPFQAFECKLAHVKPFGTEWSEEACDQFEDLTKCAKWKVVMAKTMSYVQEAPGVTMPCLQLIDTQGEQDLDIASELVRKGLARWDGAALTTDKTETTRDASVAQVAEHPDAALSPHAL